MKANSSTVFPEEKREEKEKEEVPEEAVMRPVWRTETADCGLSLE